MEKIVNCATIKESKKKYDKTMVGVQVE